MDTTIERAQLEYIKRMAETMERIEALLIKAEKARVDDLRSKRRISLSAPVSGSAP